MNLKLKSFSQDVDLSNPEKVQYFFIFELEDGKEIRLPVQKETTEELLRILYGNNHVVKEAQEIDESQEENTEEEYETDLTPEEEADQQAIIEQSDEAEDDISDDDIPANEDSIPSL